MKKIMIMLMLVLTGVVAMAQTSVWNGGKAFWKHGTGTESDPYLIESADHLAFLAFVVNKGYNTTGVFFRLTTDIDLNGSEDLPWLPIGLGARWFIEDGCARGNNQFVYDDESRPYFRGHFDGGNHCISNIYVEGESYAGLFGYAQGTIGNTVVIENVFVVNGTIAGSTCGGIVGKGQNYVTISHCWNGATITGSSDAGGIVGYGCNQVTNCYNIGDVTGRYAGGIAGEQANLIESCYNSGTIIGGESGCAGGIEGYGYSSLTINNSYNTGAVSAMGGESGTFPAAGGLVGLGRNSAITNSYNVGEVSCTNHLGCLIGYSIGSSTVVNTHYLNICDQSEVGESQSDTLMRSMEFVDLLNSQNMEPVWAFDANNLNGGFPVLVDRVFLLNVTSNPTEGGIVEGGGEYCLGYSATVTATPNEGYTFVNWTENGEVVSTEPAYSFTVTGDKRLVANFVLQGGTTTGAINAISSPAEGGAVNGAGDYTAGSECTLRVAASAGYTFVYWTENNEVVSTDSEYTFTVTGDRNLIAHFMVSGSTGELNGLFSVGENTSVSFSQGNLQYQASFGIWRFAENQYDYVGSANSSISQSYAGWIDLFGWGTSGYDDALCYQPWCTSISYSNYYPYGSYYNNLYSQTGQADWGYNAILNGGNMENSGWRTPTKEEWDYLFNTRTTSSGQRFAKARVNNVNGVILLPDDWSESYYSLAATNTAEASFESNVITADQWTALEQHGAVFLPAAGGRNQTSVYSVGSKGYYWSGSASRNDYYSAYIVYFSDENLNASCGNYRYYGHSVRLVRPAENYSINVEPSPAEGGMVNGAGNYTMGAGCTLTATASPGYTFAYWTVNGEVVSMDAEYTFPVTADRDYVAYFTLNGSTGKLNGLFSVGENNSVVFSQGNLQYQASFGIWRFAEHQYDFVGDDNSNISQTYAGWIDLFGWGTSGYNHGALCYQPWSSVGYYYYYYAYGKKTYNLFDQTGQSDWGYNAILNGGDMENSGWRTLTSEEWEYLFNTRTTSSGQRYAKAKVNNVNGVILLPDDWSESYYSFADANTSGAGFGSNDITADQWAALEQYGAVFLPAAGNRNEASVSRNRGSYWSASYYDNYSAYQVFFNTRDLSANSSNYRYYGQSVRLVRNVSTYTINIESSPTEGGTVSGAGAYESGDACTLTATPNAGYAFLNWTENGEVVSTDPAYLFVVAGDRNLVANFVEGYGCEISINLFDSFGDGWNGNTLVVNTDYGFTRELTLKDGSSSTQTLRLIDGHLVTLTWIEGGWIGECSFTLSDSDGHVFFNGSHLNGTSYEFDMDCEGMEVTNYNITASANPEAGGSVSGAGTYMAGTECTLTATPNEGYTFVNWTENGEMVSTESTYSFIVTGDRELVANFALQGSSTVPMGAINGVFSVGENTTVLFSQGNLQYIGSAGNGDENNTGAYWKFAEHQWDYLGNNGQGSNSKTVDRDLFGWGTSGYNHGANCYQPWSTSTSYSDYYAYGSYQYNLLNQTSQADWGYNAISNGGNQENNGWRMLTKDEWSHLLYYRSTSSGIRYAKATVNGIYGLILTPDNWDVSYYSLNNTNSTNAGYSSNVITASEWTVLEQHGAVFLSVAGYRFGTTICDVGSIGFYWTATHDGNSGAHDVKFYNEGIGSSDNNSRYFGQSVRLVRVVGNCSIHATPNPAEGGAVSGAGAYMAGTECTLTATANEGYSFINWTENGEVVSTESTYSFIVTGDRGLVANFEETIPTDNCWSDDFNDGVINPEMWLYTGNNVYEEDGLLKMDQNITDQNVCLLSMPMDVDDDQIITLERKFYLHRGSDYAYPRFAIEFNGETGIHGCPLHADAWDGSISNEWGVDYIGIVYGHTDWEDKYGIYLEAGVGSEIHGIRLCDAVFDTWLTEEVVVDIAAGTLSYYLEDSFVATVVIPGLSTLPISYFTWISSPWGWWTGHQHYMDYIHVCGLGDHISEITAAAEPAQGGTVTGGGTFDFGSTCTLTATPSQGYTFMYWTDNGKVVSSEPNYAFAVYGDHDFVAHFSLPLNITATANPAVGGTVTGTGVFAYNSECTLTATPNDGYTFINWTENGEVVSTETTYTFTVTGDRALVANFVEGYGCDISFNFFDSYGDGWNGNTLVVNTDYGLTRELTLDGGSSGTQTLNLIDGHHVTLTWIEGGWTYECSFTVSDSNGNVFYVGTNLNGTSYEFDWDCDGMPALTFDINASANPEEGGVVTGEGTYVYNTTCTLNATPKEGYAFVNWTENGEEVSTETTYTFTVTGDRELVANFALQGSSYLTSLSDDFNDGVIDPELWTYTGTHVLEEEGLLKLQQNVTDNYTALETLPMSVPADNKIVIDRSFFLHEQPHYWNGGDRYFGANVFIMIDGSDDNYIGIIYYDYDWDDYGATTDRHGTYVRSQIDGVTSEEIRICDVLFDTWMTEQIVVDLTTNTLSYYRDGALIATVDIPSVQPNSYTIRFKPDGWWTGHQHYMDYININLEPSSFVAQNTSLNEGWNWYSTFIELNGFGGLNLIKDGLGQNGVAIKSQQDGFLLYDNDLWMGNLNTMNNESMYLIDVNAPTMVSLTGTAATPEQHPITLAPGWNWIGYPSSMATDINTALSNLEAQDGDVVKIQNAFSQYEEGLGWTGGLNTLTPGDGIMFHSVRNQQVSFVYANGSKADALLKNITPAGNHFVPDLHVYPFNMSVMAVVELDGAELRDNRYELAAFAGNECRGSARLQYVEGLDRFIAFLTVAGDEAATLRWKLYDAETGQTYGNDQETVFEADAILGGIKNPMTLRFNSGTALTGEWLSQTCLYPNPVEANALFRIDLPANVLEKKSVEIVNALGVTVKAMTLTGSSVTLKAPKVPGVYMVKITFGNNGGYSYKLIVK